MKRPLVIILVVLLLALGIWVTKPGQKEPAVQEPVEQVETEQVQAEPVKDQPAQAAPVKAGLNLAALKNATYFGIEVQDPVTLTDGVWEGEPYEEGGSSRPSVHFMRDFLLVGDIDGDGTTEAAVLLAARGGGSGENIYLAAVRLEDGELKNLDTVLMGDRVQVRKAGFGKEHIFFEVVRAGPDDAMCCPGELDMVAWLLKNDVLTPMEVTTVPRRLSLDIIAETEWVLTWWDLEEAAPAEPEVTLSFLDGRLGGKSGCNTYFAAANTGDQPGDVSMGPAGGTMMACPEEIMAVEQRYLAQMGSVKRYGFLAGMLALTYDFDGSLGVMLFERKKSE
ncbi:MAG: META domain-containing protein [Candidatus Krumholzibacteria bacterium]|nr:META domain-containing protein [Candidatus Krumholzibacteria bacterium]